MNSTVGFGQHRLLTPGEPKSTRPHPKGVRPFLSEKVYGNSPVKQILKYVFSGDYKLHSVNIRL
jgi:hypothetical protein